MWTLIRATLAMLGLFVLAARTDAATIRDLSTIVPLRVLQRSVSAQFYKSLLISPIQDRVMARGWLSGIRLTNARLVHASSNRAYDDLALKLADEVVLAGNRSIGNLTASETVLVHLLIYRIADGTMALSFAHLDAPGGSQMKYVGSARLFVSRGQGSWEEINGPEKLRGQGWAVRESGGKNNLKLDRIPQHFSSMAPP